MGFGFSELRAFRAWRPQDFGVQGSKIKDLGPKIMDLGLKIKGLGPEKLRFGPTS